MKREKNVVDAMLFWWRYEHGTTIIALAKELEVTVATLYYWSRINKGRVPVRHLKRINDLTGGLFNPHKMRPDLFGEPPK